MSGTGRGAGTAPGGTAVAVPAPVPSGGRAAKRGTGAAPPTAVYVAVDLLALSAALVIAHLLRFGVTLAELKGTDIPYVLVSIATVPVWLGVLALAGAYDRRILGVGSDEYHRVINGAVHFLAVVAVLHLVGRLVIARGFVGVLIPVALVLTLWRSDPRQDAPQRRRIPHHSVGRSGGGAPRPPGRPGRPGRAWGVGISHVRTPLSPRAGPR